MMDAAEFRRTREGLGITREWLAGRLDIAPRTIERWEAGDQPVREFAEEVLLDLVAQAADEVACGAPSATMPESWQRRILFRMERQAAAEEPLIPETIGAVRASRRFLKGSSSTRGWTQVEVVQGDSSFVLASAGTNEEIERLDVFLDEEGYRRHGEWRTWTEDAGGGFTVQYRECDVSRHPEGGSAQREARRAELRRSVRR